MRAKLFSLVVREKTNQSLLVMKGDEPIQDDLTGHILKRDPSWLGLVGIVRS